MSEFDEIWVIIVSYIVVVVVVVANGHVVVGTGCWMMVMHQIETGSSCGGDDGCDDDSIEYSMGYYR